DPVRQVYKSSIQGKKCASECPTDQKSQSQNPALNPALKAAGASFEDVRSPNLFFLLRATGSCPENQPNPG
ncbi:hypothetical protein, partial [Methanothrix sp.]|uniref:hypothetical protein n=1 Tax=Methanothrix sp. TaxID=90426 RepID=UPI003C777E85